MIDSSDGWNRVEPVSSFLGNTAAVLIDSLGYSDTCNSGATWYQDGKYGQCCPASLASCYAPTACVSGYMIYPYSDLSTTRTIAWYVSAMRFQVTADKLKALKTSAMHPTQSVIRRSSSRTCKTRTQKRTLCVENLLSTGRITATCPLPSPRPLLEGVCHLHSSS